MPKQENNSHIKYRPDIDGLRALAVIAVLLFHAEFEIFSGGFIGVDVFFVISGYLITSILLKSLQANNFSLLTFYDRRIRRIFPALFAVLGVSTLVATLIMMPQEYARFGLSIASTASFSSNILFWREAGYFDLGLSMKPLLHTWSIAVEEQFYIFFPIYLFLVFKYARKFMIPLTLLGLVFSFGLSIWTLSIHKPIPTFFLLPTRAWELVAGSLLAFGFLPTLKNKHLINALSLIGFALVVVPIFVFTSAISFPGPNAAYPVIGTVLLIYAGMSHSSTAWINHALSLRPFVFTGKISYSLYLWHWPIFVFCGYIAMRDLGTWEKIGLLVLCFIISAASWKFIEEPFRQKDKTYNRKHVFGAAFILTTLFIAMGLIIYFTKGLPNRYSEEIQNLTMVEKGANTPDYQIDNFNWPETKQLGITSEYGNPDATFVVWGDSHANAGAPAASAAAKDAGVSGFVIKQAGCMPSFGMTAEILSAECAAFNIDSKRVLDSTTATKIIMIARWSAYPRWISKTNEATGTEDSRATFERLLTDTITTLKSQGKEVIIMAEVPRAQASIVPSVLGRTVLFNRPVDLRGTKETYLQEQAHLFEIFDRLSKKHGTKIIYPHKTFCTDEMPDDKCMVIKDGKTLYFDASHLSTFGAEQVGSMFDGVFR